MEVLIYWIGVIIAFILMRWFRHKEEKQFDLDSDWGIIIITTLFCFLSWIMVIVSILMLLMTIKHKSNIRPPKWL